ncbi:TMV resistance protein N [Artemisia annua]|uniref:TMV resistance protein N n=1 Tax=Artemisia annua TaxID=35608 RepID=A0A2U1QGB6_ARTAN|nr:TMV resistance protein N [Artemisia annua]
MVNVNFKNLKILDVTDSSSLTKIGNFIGLENLEELRLRGCSTLEELDSSIGCLQKLVELNLEGCSRLKSLPWEMIGKLTSLQYLNLENCPNIPEISHEVGSLISLERLFISKSNFSNLPNSLCQLHQLVHLHVADCINLVNLPSNFSELQFLTLLQLDNCSKLGSKGFTQVTGLRNLYELTMKKCNVSQVSSEIGNLVSLWSLDLSGNTFSSLPESFSNLSKLECLTINDCSQLQLLPPLPSQLKNIEAANCGSLDVMPFDSMQKAYIFRSKAFKELLTSTERLYIGLSWEELPEWCTCRNSGKVLSFVAPIQFDSQICGLILCGPKLYEDDGDDEWLHPTIYNKTKGTSHKFYPSVVGSPMFVTFYPLNDTTLVVEAGDTVEVEFHDEVSLFPLNSVGLRLVYEDDVVDSELVLKDVREPLFPTSEMSVRYSRFNDTTLVVEVGDTVEVEFDDEGSFKSCGLRLVYEDEVVDSGLVLKDVRSPHSLCFH